MDVVTNEYFFIFAHEIGRLAEWLGIGLQNRVRRFESATDLNENLHRKAVEVFVFQTEPWPHERGMKNQKPPKPAKQAEGLS